MQHIQSALEVRLKDTSSATLQAVLRFCYTAECHLTPDNVLPICALAEHFEVKALHSACVQFIEHNISVSSCCTMLEMAAQYNMEALRKVSTALSDSLTICIRSVYVHARLNPHAVYMPEGHLMDPYACKIRLPCTCIHRNAYAAIAVHQCIHRVALSRAAQCRCQVWMLSCHVW